MTPLENWLRERDGGAAYETSFVEHYVVPLLYPAALTREAQLALGVAVVAINAVAYAFVVHRLRHRRN